jgi:hypothetical protein
VFTVIVGVWGLLQVNEFCRQDPRVTLLTETGLFIGLPALNLVMLTWLSGLLGGIDYVPLAIGIIGLVSIRIFVIPLQSSFVKQGTPPDKGLILPNFLGILYIFLAISLPGIIYAGLNFSLDMSPYDYLILLMYFITPTFLLSAFDFLGIMNWMGEVNIAIIRWLSGSVTMVTLSLLLYFNPSSTAHFTTISIPILFTYFALVSLLGSQEDSSPSLPATSLALIVAILILAAAYQLPWSITYNFSMFSLPLSIFQSLLLVLSLLSLVLLVFWQKDLTLIWPTYHAIFVGCEYILNSEGFYHLTLLLATCVAGVILCLRLHSIGRLTLPLAILCISLHLAKLSQLFPVPDYTSSSSLLSFVSFSASMVAFIKLSTSEVMSLRMVMSMCAIVSFGLMLSIEISIEPIFNFITHRPPTSADVAAFVCVITGLNVRQFLARVRNSFPKSICLHLPQSFLAVAGLLWLLQPDFNLFEIASAFGTIFLHHSNINIYLGRVITTEQILLLAWTIIIKWGVILYGLLIVFTLSLKIFVPPPAIALAGSILGALVCLLVSLVFAHHLPLSVMGVLYITSGLAAGVLLSLILVKKPDTTNVLIERTLLLALTALCGVTVIIEYLSVPFHVTEYVPLPSGHLFLVVFVLIPALIRLRIFLEDINKPFLPIVANISCLIAYILAISLQLPVHLDKAVIISISSCVMLLAQEDGYIMPTNRTKGLFLAPSLVLSSLTMFLMSFVKLYFQLSSNTIVTVLNLICLVAAVPGHIRFLYCLWRGSPFRYSVIGILLYIIPNGFLTQFGGSLNVMLGFTSVLCFCLLAISEFQTLTVL